MSASDQQARTVIISHRTSARNIAAYTRVRTHPRVRKFPSAIGPGGRNLPLRSAGHGRYCAEPSLFKGFLARAKRSHKPTTCTRAQLPPTDFRLLRRNRENVRLKPQPVSDYLQHTHTHIYTVYLHNARNVNLYGIFLCSQKPIRYEWLRCIKIRLFIWNSIWKINKIIMYNSREKFGRKKTERSKCLRLRLLNHRLVIA